VNSAEQAGIRGFCYGTGSGLNFNCSELELGAKIVTGHSCAQLLLQGLSLGKGVTRIEGGFFFGFHC
jgi:hypothetical protein